MSVKLVLVFVTALMPAVAMAGPGDDTGAKKKNPQQQATRMSTAELAMLQHRHDVNLMEIEMGKIAQQRGSAEVKKYATMLVNDHQKADKDVMALARSRGVALTEHVRPTNEVEAAQHKQQMRTMERLRTLEGAEFDRAYLKAMVDGHTAEIGRVTSEIGRASDPKLKALLVKTKPSLERHAERARELLVQSDEDMNRKKTDRTAPTERTAPGTPPRY